MSEVPEKKSRPSLTRSPAWRALAAHHRNRDQHSLRDLFAAGPRRFEQFSLEACGLLADYSKNRITEETLALLLALAREREQIKQEVVEHGETVNGAVMQAVFVRGRTSWDTKKLDGYVAAHPEV